MDRVTSEPAGPNQDLDEPLDLCVVLPCHNVADTLAEQLEALTAERWRGSWTILVVDNRSTDGTAAVAVEYRERGVHLLAADEGSGVAYVRNAGAAAVASSRSVAFCDGDDVVQPGWVAALGDALEGHDLVSGVIDTQRLNPSWLARSRPMADSGEMPNFGGTPFASGGNCGIRMSLYRRLAGFDESFAGLEDIEFSLRAAAIGVAAVRVPEAVLSYRMRATPSQVWRQGQFYGGSQPLLIRRAEALGLAAPSRLHGVRSWAWLVRHLPGLATRAGRYRWLWVLSCRVGVLRRAAALRSFYL